LLGATTKVLTEDSSNPYASIGPPKESAEIANRTHNTNEVASFGIGSPQSGESRNLPEQTANGQVEIPIGNSPIDAKSPSIEEKSVDKKGGPGIPIMFIKRGANLIPVYNSGNDGTSGASMSGIVKPPPVVEENRFMSSSNLEQPKVLPLMNTFSDTPQTTQSRCSIPGACEQDVSQDVSLERVPDSQMTGELIDKLIHTPGFPQLASKFMSEGRFNYDSSRNLQQEGGFRDVLGPREDDSGYRNVQPQEGGSRNVVPISENSVDGINPAEVSFNMKGNYAQSNLPDQPSMIQDEQRNDRHEQDIEDFLQHQPRQNSDVSDNPLRQQQRATSRHGIDGRFVNDISDPEEESMEMKYQQKSADELLDLAKYRSMTAPDTHAPMGSQLGLPPPENTFSNLPAEPPMSDFQQQQQQHEPSSTTPNEESEPSIANRFINEDPSTLLDDLHKTQMTQGLNGAGDPLPQHSEGGEEAGEGRHHIPDPVPDDLLDQVRKFNNRMDERQQQHRRRVDYERQNLNHGFGDMDPSFADEIRDKGGLLQHFDVERKDLATENDAQLLKSRNGRPHQNYGELSVMSGDAVQFRNGRLSMDSNDVLNSFGKEGSFSRNRIGRPNRRHRGPNKRRFLHPYTRGSIEKPLGDSDIELRVNGKPMTDSIQLRSTIVNGKVSPGKGKTFTSKDPIQIELSHGENKRKIINIKTKGKYKVLNEKKRFKIPHVGKANETSR